MTRLRRYIGRTAAERYRTSGFVLHRSKVLADLVQGEETRLRLGPDYAGQMLNTGLPSDAVQVELVGQTWWSAALPLLAIVISLISLGTTLWLKFRDDARLELEASQGYVMGRGQDGILFLHLQATNIGRSGSTVIQNIGLRLADGQGIASISPTIMDSSFPMTLSPGESAHRYFKFDELAAQLLAADQQGNGLRIEALTGHGRVRAKVPKKTVNRLYGR